MTYYNEKNDPKPANKINSSSFNSSSLRSDIIENDDCFPDETEIEQAFGRKSFSSNRSFEERELNKAHQALQPFILLDYLKFNNELKLILESDLKERQIVDMANSILRTDNESSLFDLSTLKEQIDSYIAAHKKKLLTMIPEESKENIIFSTIQPLMTQDELSRSQKDKEDALSIEVVKEIDENKFGSNDLDKGDGGIILLSSKDFAKEEIMPTNTRNGNIKRIIVHERLYNQRKPFKLDIMELQVKSPHSKTNSNSRSQSKEYFQRQYRDLDKRRSKSKKESEARKDIKGKSKPLNHINKIQIKQNISTNKLLYTKYLQSYHQTIAELHSRSLIKSNSAFEFEDIFLIFQKLNFIKQLPHMTIDINPNLRTTTSSYHKQEDINKIRELFDSIKEPNEAIVLNHNLFIFCLSILNLNEYHHSLQKNNDSKNTQETNITAILENRKYSSFSSKGNLLISAYKSKTISKDFQSMNHNWKQTFHHHRNRNNDKGKARTPTVGSKSLSTNNDNNNNKRLQSYSQDIINRQLLHYQLRKSKLALLKEENDKKELSDCTFKPSLTRYKSKEFALSNFLLSSAQMSKQGSKAKIELKNKEKEADKKGYSFKPKINNINVKQVKEMYSKISNQQISYENEKHNERMVKGRIERDKKASAFKLRESYANEGIKSTSNKDYSQDASKAMNLTQVQMKKCSINLQHDNDRLSNHQHHHQNHLFFNDYVNENKRKRLLVIIDIKINNKNKRLMAYEGDTAKGLARNFILENNVPKDKELKLQLQIQNELNKAVL